MQHRLNNAITQRAQDIAEQASVARYGIVESVDPTTGTVKVTLKPDGVLTGWLPVGTMTLGAGWGMWAMPDVGQQVLVHPEYGDANSGVVTAAVPMQGALPPQAPSAPGGSPSPASAGEFLLVGKAGNVIRICADGTMYSRGTWNHEGDFFAKGNVSDEHGSLDRLRGNYNLHTHPGVQTGTGSTAATLSVDPE